MKKAKANTEAKNETPLHVMLAEAAAKIGLDSQETRNLYRRLCFMSNPAAGYVAMTVERALALYVEADNLMKALASVYTGPDGSSPEAEG